MAAEDVNGEIVLVAESGDPEVSEAGEGWQRSITADYDPSCKLVQFVQCGEEVFGTLEPIEPEEWQQMVDRLGRAAPFMARVLALVQEIERIADGAEPVPDLQRELRAAVKVFAGAIEPEQVVEVAHAADAPLPPSPSEEAALARILFERHGGAGPRESGGPSTTAWDDLGELVKDAYLETAREALAELRRRDPAEAIRHQIIGYLRGRAARDQAEALEVEDGNEANRLLANVAIFESAAEALEKAATDPATGVGGSA